jgi:hypothetical protein
MNAIDEPRRGGVVKALSIQQPWAYCITNGTKRVENRTWKSSFRGLLLIHAGKSFQPGVVDPIHADSPEIDKREMFAAPRGGIVGFARMIDCISVATDYHRIPTDQRIWSAARGTPGQYVFLFSECGPLPFIPYRGGLGFFSIDTGSHTAIDAALRTFTEVAS